MQLGAHSRPIGVSIPRCLCPKPHLRHNQHQLPAAIPSADSERARVLRYKDEYNFRLSEYMVVLDKPLGLTLAPDPITGHITVQNIRDGSPAASSHLIQVGDIVRKCSAVFGEDMWHAVDLRRMRWAINNRTSKVKLVFERARRPLPSLSVWYNKGQVGSASVERDVLQLPVSFVSTTFEDDWSQDLVAPGRPMFVGFHRSIPGSAEMPQFSSAAARQARLQHLREELVQTSGQGAVNLRGAEHPPGNSPMAASSSRSRGSSRSGSSGNNNNKSNNNSMSKNQNGGSSNGHGTTSQAEKRVYPFLQWLLITSGRLDTRELTTLASVCGLGSLLELALSLTSSGHLSVKGTEGMQLPELNVKSLLTAAPPGSSPLSKGQPPINGTPATASGQQLALLNSALGSQQHEVRMLIHAAACLQRLTFRRQGSFHHSCKERCAILLHCEPGAQAKVGTLLAGWLHWFWHMPLQEAVLSAEMSTGSKVDTVLLGEATEQLLHWANEHINQVVLTWKYGAMSVSVAGDIVGNWNKSVALVRCSNPSGCKGSTSRGHFFLPLTGLQPGVYYYKFIVDGTWTVDPSAPKVIDTSGNYNNVLEVHARPQCTTGKEKLQMARLQAAQLALETKLVPMH